MGGGEPQAASAARLGGGLRLSTFDGGGGVARGGSGGRWERRGFKGEEERERERERRRRWWGVWFARVLGPMDLNSHMGPVGLLSRPLE